MLPETFTAAFLGVCLGVFLLVNLGNMMNSRRIRKTHATLTKTEPSEEPEPPKTIILGLAAFGTLLFWSESILYVVFVFAGVLQSLNSFLLPLRFTHDSYVQVVGVILSVFGYFVFTWSVIAERKL
ncbi:hypothetical protein KEJ18_07140, partial [Candidatus Bathyarchaeota archaeon]|nr:hypothetical protein [Candidatus Bathyarchaeota archaeon]